MIRLLRTVTDFYCQFQPRITGRPRTSKRIWTKEDNIKRKARRQRNRSAFGTSEAPFGRSANLDTGTSPELSSEEEERPAKRRQVEKPHVSLTHRFLCLSSYPNILIGSASSDTASTTATSIFPRTASASAFHHCCTVGQWRLGSSH